MSSAIQLAMLLDDVAEAAVSYVRQRRLYRAAVKTLLAEMNREEGTACFDGFLHFLAPIEGPLRDAVQQLDGLVGQLEQRGWRPRRLI
jgi:hypothetical protein